MQASDGAPLSGEQRAAAAAGLKPLMPVAGRPFLDYVLSSLADAGSSRAALIVAPQHEAVRMRYAVDCVPERITVDFVVQAEPEGTASAVLAAEDWTSGEPFLVVNADNLYPSDVLRQLALQRESACPVFSRDELVRSSNIPPDRVQEFALVHVDEEGYVSRIFEKPSVESLEAAGPSAGVSMNCWRFESEIFTFCRAVPRSPRGEFELPEAVDLAVRRGFKMKAIRGHGPVLDLSRRGDVEGVERRLAGMSVRP